MSFPRVEGYVVVEKLGSGSYSTVYKAYPKVGARTVVAIKVVDKSRLKHSESGVDNLITEIKLLKTLRHPYIVQMHDFTWDDKHIMIVMEYCMGDLSRYIRRCGRLPESRLLFFLQQLASALQFLRDKGVAHMDLKPHNLLLSKSTEGKYTLKVADFGFAQYMSADTIKCSIRGSPLYMAPEMLTEDNPTYDASVDLWSVGVIMYECLFGKAPYSSTTFKELMEKIVNRHPIEFPRSVPISEGCADLLTRLLQHDPVSRITHEEFFSHAYLDMLHMPSPENYDKAVGLIKRAVEADSKKQLAEAFNLYCESLRYLVPVVNSEMDSVRKSALRAKVAQYMKRAEELKTLLSAIRQMDCNVPSMVHSPRCAAAASATPVRRRTDAAAKAQANIPTRKMNCFCNCTQVQVSTSDSVKFTNGCSCPHVVSDEKDSDHNRARGTRQKQNGSQGVSGQSDNDHNRTHLSHQNQSGSQGVSGQSDNEHNRTHLSHQNQSGSQGVSGQSDNDHNRTHLSHQNQNGSQGVRNQTNSDHNRSQLSGQNQNTSQEVTGQIYRGHSNVISGSGKNYHGHAIIFPSESNCDTERQNSFKSEKSTGNVKNITETNIQRENAAEANTDAESWSRGPQPERKSLNETENIPRLDDESVIVEEPGATDKPKKMIFGETQDVCRLQ